MLTGIAVNTPMTYPSEHFGESLDAMGAIATVLFR